jgi:copper chaperone CopZ
MESKTTAFSDITFPVQGMSCGSCVRHIKAALERNTGVKAVEVNLAACEVTVSYNPQTTEPGAIAETIRRSGYRPGSPRRE